MPRISKEEELARLNALAEKERGLRRAGYNYIAGVDEAGRGPLAGDVYAAAVIFPADLDLEELRGLNDSKKMSPKKRDELFDKIMSTALAFSIASVDAHTIDEINILNATHRAMCAAVNGLSVCPDYVLIDGNSISGMAYPHETVVGGDASCIAISAASVLAKVARDRYITELAEQYPEYGFERHKGYGTKEHTQALLQYGACPIHRQTFIKKILQKRESGGWV